MRWRDEGFAMTVRSCILWPNKCMCNRALPVATITDKVRRHWACVIKMMLGVILAAMQISVSMGFVVVNASEARGRVAWMAITEILHVWIELCAHYDAKGHCEQRNRVGLRLTST